MECLPLAQELRAHWRSLDGCVSSWGSRSSRPVRPGQRAGERNHGTHEERMVKKLRRKKKLATHAAMSQYLESEYCDEYNQRFAIEPKSKVDYHLPAPGAKRQKEIFRAETERVLSNDWVVRQDNRVYQVDGQNRVHAPAESKVTVCEWEDGTIEIHYRGQKLKWHEIEERPAKPPVVKKEQRRRTIAPPAAAMPEHRWWKRHPDRKTEGPPGKRIETSR